MGGNNMEDKKVLAIPLEEDKEYLAMKKAANQAANDYCKNVEFVCHLGGGDPKATIHNLRFMAYTAGFEQAWKLIGMFSKDLKEQGH